MSARYMCLLVAVIPSVALAHAADALVVGIANYQNLNAAQLTDVQAFFDSYYAPNNATLVVVGDFQPLELRRYVNAYFSTIPRHPDPPAVTCTSRLSPGVQRREVTDAHANLPAVLRIYRGPAHADPDTRALELLNIILGQGESSRLNVTVVRRDKAALGTQVTMNPFDSRRGPAVLLTLGIANQGGTMGAALVADAVAALEAGMNVAATPL